VFEESFDKREADRRLNTPFETHLKKAISATRVSGFSQLKGTCRRLIFRQVDGKWGLKSVPNLLIQFSIRPFVRWPLVVGGDIERKRSPKKSQPSFKQYLLKKSMMGL
jgi:hypothetical protein